MRWSRLNELNWLCDAAYCGAQYRQHSSLYIIVAANAAASWVRESCPLGAGAAGGTVPAAPPSISSRGRGSCADVLRNAAPVSAAVFSVAISRVVSSSLLSSTREAAESC